MHSIWNSKLLQFTGLGILIEGLAILAFAFVARTDWLAAGKQVVLIFFLVLISFLIIRASAALSITKLIWLSIFLSFGGVFVFELIGFTVFPGLVKDVTPFSLEHMKGAILLLMLVFICYVTGIFTILLAKKLVSLLH